MKTALVTGASYGLGLPIAQSLLDAGWKVYGLSRTKPPIDHAQFVWLECDLSQADLIPECLAVIGEPQLDAFISNAGVIHAEKASAATAASYHDTFSVNVLAPMVIVNALCRQLEQSVILSVSSVSDRIPDADIALYCSSKAANTSYFDSLAAEFTSARVVTLLPDYIDTPMLRHTMAGQTGFDWTITIQPADLAKLTLQIITGEQAVESGANIIVVTNQLKGDLASVEKLYGYNTDTAEFSRLR